MSTHNICFRGEIRKKYLDTSLIWGCVMELCMMVIVDFRDIFSDFVVIF